MKNARYPIVKGKTAIYKTVHAIETKEVDEKSRTLIVKISTSDVDRSGDIVIPTGVILNNYLNNPVVAAFHRYDEPSIAKTIEMKVKDDHILAKLEFVPEGKYPLADILYEQYKGGFMNAWSIGFRPVEYEEIPEAGYKFTKWELFEYSAVLVPDNANALTIMRSKGFSDEEISKALDATKEKEKTRAEYISKKKDDDKPEEKKDVHDARLKDVSQVTGLSYLMSDLNYMIAWFEQSDVAETTTEKMKQALALLMEAVKEQAELGKKAFDVTKMGRTISSKHEGLLKEACEHMKAAAEQLQTVLDTVAEQDDGEGDGKSVPATSTFLQKLANSMKTNNQKQDLTLRLLKEIKGEKGGEK